MKKKQNIIKIIAPFIIFGIILLVALLPRLWLKNPIDDWSEKAPSIPPFAMQRVTDYTMYFAVINTINQYFDYISTKNIAALDATLHPKYKEELQITEANVLEKIDSYSHSATLKAKEISYKELAGKTIFYINADVVESTFETENILQEDLKYLLVVDYEQLGYYVYPLEEEGEELPINPEEEIITTEYNILVGSNLITDNFICNLYYMDFLNRLEKDVLATYDLLEKEYREESFSHRSTYLNYMNYHREKLSSKILTCERNDRTYKVKDENYNTITFYEESVMNYKVKFTFVE